ncbi:MAG: hypothetical protein ACFHU9_09665 [Fluviicola sp.]
MKVVLYTFIAGIMATSFVACNNEAEETEEKVSEELQEGKEEFQEERGEMEEELKELQAKIELRIKEVDEKLEEEGEEGKAELQEARVDLENEAERLEQAIKDLGKATENDWDQLKANTRSTIDDTKEWWAEFEQDTREFFNGEE